MVLLWKAWECENIVELCMLHNSVENSTRHSQNCIEHSNNYWANSTLTSYISYLKKTKPVLHKIHKKIKLSK